MDAKKDAYNIINQINLGGIVMNKDERLVRLLHRMNKEIAEDREYLEAKKKRIEASMGDDEMWQAVIRARETALNDLCYYRDELAKILE